MYPFVRDMRSIALLQKQHQLLGLSLDSSNNNSSNHNVNIGNQLLSAQRGSGTNQSMVIDATSMVSVGLSSSELRSAASLQKTESMMTAKLLKQHQQQQNLGREDQVVKAMALATRGLPFSITPSNNEQQQHNPNSRSDLILKGAIDQLSMASRYYPMQQHDRSLHSRDSLHPTTTIRREDPNQQHRDASPSRCAEQNLSISKDICFGRGQRVQRRKANVSFRKIVATYQETYDRAVSREDKKAVVKKVSRILTRTGYRFFKESEEAPLYGDGSKMWVAVSDNDVEYKIGHSFRSGRKQIKQQQKNNQRKDAENDGGDVGNIGKSGTESNNSSSTTKDKKSPSRSIVETEPSDDECVFKESELPDHCICIGDQREKHTGMESYQYFREFILTFKSIFGMSSSLDEKTKIVSSLIDQIKSRKGYRFLKLISMKKDVEFWIEASTHDIECEVFSILGNPLKAPEEKTVDKQKHGPPKKRQRRLPDGNSPENFSRPSGVKQNVSDLEQPKTKEKKATTTPRSMSLESSFEKDARREDLVSSSSVTSTTKSEESLPRKKGKKRTLRTANKKPSSEIIGERPTTTGKFETDLVTNYKLKNGTDSIFKVGEEAISANLRQSLSVPPSLSIPNVFFGTMSYDNFPLGSSIDPAAKRGNLSFASNMASGEKMLQGRKGRQLQMPGFGLSSTSLSSRSDTLGKALHAMRSTTSPLPNLPATYCREEQSMMIEKAKQINAMEHLERRAKLLEHLKQQELLYIEKKHKLDMLDLQLQSPDSRM